MSIKLPNPPGRRAFIKGGLVAAIAGALSSCAGGSVPAFAQAQAAAKPLFPYGIFESLLTTMRDLRERHGGPVTNEVARATALHHLSTMGVDQLPAQFTNDKFMVELEEFSTKSRYRDNTELLVWFSIKNLETGEVREHQTLVLNREFPEA
jgi:hypothetical protein